MTDSPLKLCVFDCDGTLVDSQESIVQSMQTSFVTEGFPAPSPEAVRRVVGLPLIDAIAKLVPEENRDTHAHLTEGYRSAFRKLRDADSVHEPLFPGVVEALEALEAKGWLLGVATGKAHHGLISTLGTHDLEGHFVTLQTADRAHGKPHPDMMLRAMEETGVEAGRAVMIGDTTYDIEMARNAGTYAVGVTWGYHGEDELRAAGAHAMAAEFSDLLALVEDLVEA